MVLGDDGGSAASLDIAAGDVGVVDTGDGNGGDGAGINVFSASCRPLDVVKSKPVSLV